MEVQSAIDVKALGAVPASIVAMLLLALIFGTPPAGEAGPVISEIRSRPLGERLELRIAASAPLSYATVDSREPFRLILYLPGATFAFPPTPLHLEEGPLRSVVPVELTREGGTLGQIEFTFSDTARYDVSRDGNALAVTVALPARGEARTLFGREASPILAPSEPAPPPAAAAASTTPASPPPRSATVHRVVVTSKGKTTTVRVHASGPLTYRATRLKASRRLIVDLLGATYRPGAGAFPGRGPLVSRVRVFQLRAEQPTVRIILELLRLVPHRIERLERELLIHAGH